MSEGIIIRHYREEDLPQLRLITVESFGGVALEQILESRFGLLNGRSWSERKAEHIDEDCRENPGGVFIAEKGGEILGYITTRIELANARGRIPNMAVIEKARGLGLGRRLIQHALDYFRQSGMKIAQIETMASNDVGQYLYPSCGFQEVARQVHYAMEL
jgi:ribosomal protein S18 acetylase RimI-like enzyme